MFRLTSAVVILAIVPYPGLFMNDLAGFGPLAGTPMNMPERPLTARTLTPTTQNHIPLIHQGSSAS